MGKAKVWLQHYPKGVPADITDQASAYSSLVQMFDESCRQYADRYAYQSMGAAITYAELHHHVEALAAWLQHNGVKKGDRVALMMPNLMQYPVALFAVLRVGAIVVNINPLYTPHELEHQLRDCGATTIFIAENFAHTLQKVVEHTDIKRVVVTGIGDMLGGLKGRVTNFVVRHVKKMVPAWTLPNHIRFNDALTQGTGLTTLPVALTHDDIAFLQYTGGTTGVAKGAILTHGNVVANVCQACAWLQPYIDLSKPECIVTALPLYHIFALTANCLVFMRIGAKNLLIVNARDIPSLVKELARNRFTAITGVNTLFSALLNHPDFKTLDFSKLKFALGGGMAVQQAVSERWLRTTGKPIAQAYGLTETSPAATINPLDQTEFTGSIGLPVPSTDIVVRDIADNRLAVGESGELCIKGPQVTPGYWQRPEETALAFDTEGYLRTGDIGYMDAQGYFYILDRKKDMILVSGFNVYPNEVEAAAAEHPDIIEAAAIGVPDARSGEVVKLFVIARRPDLTAEEVIAHCRGLLSGYKVPKHVEFRETLPRTNVGKILRRQLKEEAS